MYHPHRAPCLYREKVYAQRPRYNFLWVLLKLIHCSKRLGYGNFLMGSYIRLHHTSLYQSEPLMKSELCAWEHKAFYLQCVGIIIQLNIITLLNTAMHWWRRDTDQNSISQITPHTSPSRARYGVSFVCILENIDCVMMAPHCILCVTVAHCCLAGLPAGSRACNVYLLSPAPFCTR